MFHTYVRAYSGASIDFDRAAFLMDRFLLDQSFKALASRAAAGDEEFDFAVAERMGVSAPKWDNARRAQFAWEDYCHRHREKYGTPFRPNIDPTWDQ